MKNSVLTMKTFLKTWKKIILLCLFALLAAPLLTACGKKGGGGDPAPVALPPPVVTQNGVYGDGNILNNLQFAASYMQGAVNLGGTGNFDWNNPGIVHQYIGPVNVTGTLQVMNQTLCGAPLGTYSLVGQGQIKLGILYNTTLSAAGPVNLQILISQATAYNPQMTMNRNTPGNRFGIQMANLLVNGQPCGQVTSY
jgi:hypothetical protein